MTDMTDNWDRKYPVLLILLSAFYLIAAAFAVIATVMMLTGRPVSGLPPIANAPILAAESVLFLFFAYGLMKGWRAAWVLILVMNLIWMSLDTYNYVLGNLDSPVPILIALASIVVLFTGGVRRQCHMTRGEPAGH